MKKFAILALVLVGALALAWWIWGITREPKPGPSPLPLPVATAAPVPSASVPEAATEVKDEEKLQGSDFLVRTRRWEDDRSKSLGITLTDGKEITECCWLSGERCKLEDVRLDICEKLTLKRILPESQREQLEVSGEEYLFRGEGTIGNYAL